MYVCMYVCMYVRVCMYVCMYVRMYVRTCMYVCMYVTHAGGIQLAVHPLPGPMGHGTRSDTQ